MRTSAVGWLLVVTPLLAADLPIEKRRQVYWELHLADQDAERLAVVEFGRRPSAADDLHDQFVAAEDAARERIRAEIRERYRIDRSAEARIFSEGGRQKWPTPFPYPIAMGPEVDRPRKLLGPSTNHYEVPVADRPHIRFEYAERSDAIREAVGKLYTLPSGFNASTASPAQWRAFNDRWQQAKAETAKRVAEMELDLCRRFNIAPQLLKTFAITPDAKDWPKTRADLERLLAAKP